MDEKPPDMRVAQRGLIIGCLLIATVLAGLGWKACRPRQQAAVNPLGVIVVPQDYGQTPPQFQVPTYSLPYRVALYDAKAAAGAAPLGSTYIDKQWNAACYRENPRVDLVEVTADPVFVAVPDPHYHGRWCVFYFPPNMPETAGIQVVARYTADCVTDFANPQPVPCDSAPTPPSAWFTKGDVEPIPPEPEPPTLTCPEGTRPTTLKSQAEGVTYSWVACAAP